MNELTGTDGGLGWDLLMHYGANEWHLEVWIVPPSSPLASALIEPLCRVLTRARRKAILTLKENLVLNDITYRSIDLYRAVIDNHVETTDEYLAWALKHGSVGQCDWLPEGNK